MESVLSMFRENDPWPRPLCLVAGTEVGSIYTSNKAYKICGHWPSHRYYKSVFRHLCAYKFCDAVIFGGGGLFAEKYSIRSIRRYANEALIPIALNKPIAMFGVGALPVTTWFNKKLVKLLLRSSAFVGARDIFSSQLFIDHFPNANVAHTGDATWLMSDGEIAELAGKDRYLYGTEYSVLNFRRKPAPSHNQIRKLLLRSLSETERVLLLAAEPTDKVFFERIVKENHDLSDRISIPKASSLGEVFKIIRDAKFVVATRLHVNVAAIRLRKPLVIINYEEKVERFADGLTGPFVLADLDSVDGKDINAMIDRFGLSYGESFFEERRTMALRARNEMVERITGCYGRDVSYSFRDRVTAFFYWGFIQMNGFWHLFRSALWGCLGKREKIG